MIFQTLYLYYLTVRPTRTLLCLMTNLQNDSCQSIKTAKDHATELQKYEPSRGSFSGYKMPQYRLQPEIQTQVYETVDDKSAKCLMSIYQIGQRSDNRTTKI